MPSRRALLVTSSAVLPATAIGGCLSMTDTLSAELLQLKAITVTWTHDGRSYRDQLLQLHSDGESEITGSVVREYSQLASQPSEITVSRDVHDELEREFETVKYIVGFCGDEFDSDDDFGCRNTGISRADFNAVQFGNRAEVTVDDGTFHLEEVTDDEGASGRGWETDINDVDWTERHAEKGAKHH